MQTVELAVIVFNLITFLIMGFDKYAARKRMQRAPEKILLALAVLGGSIGIWLGMKMFRHKTRHPRFMYGIPLIIALQIAAFFFFSL